MIETVLDRLVVMKEEDAEGERGAGDVDPRGVEEGKIVQIEHAGGDGEGTGEYAKDKKVSINGRSVVETESGMKLESRTPGEDVPIENDSYVVTTETESGMKLESRSQGEEVSSNNGTFAVETGSGMKLESRSPGNQVGQDQKQQEKHDAMVEDPPASLTMEGFHDIRLVPDCEEGEEKCDKKLKNYAWRESGAVIMDHSSALKGAEHLLDNSLDKYSISPCNEKKIAVMALSEDIVVRSVALVSYEKYSSLVKEFQVLGSQIYPTEEWMDLGTFITSGTPGEETFNLVQSAFARYLKFKFIAHVGNEYYCTLNQIKVHGITAIENVEEHITASTDEAEEINKILSAVADQETIVLNVSVNVQHELEATSSTTNLINYIHGPDVHQEQRVVVAAAEGKQYSDNSGGLILNTPGPEVVPAGEQQPSNIVHTALQEAAVASGDTGKALETASAGAESNVMTEKVVVVQGSHSSSLGSVQNDNTLQHSTSELSTVIEDRGGATPPPERPLLVEPSASLEIHDPPPSLVDLKKIDNKNGAVCNNSSVKEDNEKLHSIDDEFGGDAAVFRSTEANSKNLTTAPGKEVAVEGTDDAYVVEEVVGNVSNVADVQGRKVNAAAQKGEDNNSTTTSYSAVDDGHQNIVLGSSTQFPEESMPPRRVIETPNQQHEQLHIESELNRAATGALNQYILHNNNLNPLPHEVLDTLDSKLSTFWSEKWLKLQACNNALGFSEYKNRMMSKVILPNPVAHAVSPYTKALTPVIEKIRNLEINDRLHEKYSEMMQDCNQLHLNVLLEVNKELMSLHQEIKTVQQQSLAHSTTCLRVPPFVVKVVYDGCNILSAFPSVTVLLFAIIFVLTWACIGKKKGNNLNPKRLKEV